jgi:hypothetical protein
VLGDHHAAVDDPHQGTAATGPVHVAGKPGCSKSGMGIERSLLRRKIVDRSGVIKLIERRRTDGLQ